MKSFLKDTLHEVALSERPLTVDIDANLCHESNTALLSCRYPNHPEVAHDYNMSLHRLTCRPLVSYDQIASTRYTAERWGQGRAG